MSFVGLPLDSNIIDSGTIDQPVPGGGVSGSLPPLTNDYGNAAQSILNQVTGSDSALGRALSGNNQQTPTVSTPNSTGLDQYGNPIPGNTAGGETALSKAAGWLGLPSLSQAVAIILGLVLIAGGIFLLSKGPVVQIAKGAAKDLALGA